MSGIAIKIRYKTETRKFRANAFGGKFSDCCHCRLMNRRKWNNAIITELPRLLFYNSVFDELFSLLVCFWHFIYERV